jgi:hypothetical protein
MSDISTQLSKIADWTSPRRAIHRGGRECPFLLSSTLLEGPASESELVGFTIDRGLREFWLTTKSADLFKDTKYGQWGLRILSPEKSREETEKVLLSRSNDFRTTDLIIGKFYGDSDLLILDTACSRSNGLAILVALPLGSRVEWKEVAGSFSEFLSLLLFHEGDKYWEI